MIYREKKDGPTINWFDMQPELKQADADVLLILDCCHAGQATRSRRFVQLQPVYETGIEIPPSEVAQFRCRKNANVIEHSAADEMCREAPSLGQATRNQSHEGRNRVEILMACGMGLETPGPGPGSFTTALVKVLRLWGEFPRSVETTELVKELSKKEARLPQSPTHVTVQTRALNRTIEFTPQPRKPLEPTSLVKASSIHIRLYTRTRVDQNSLHVTLAWLKENAPSEVSGIQVDDIHGTLQEFLNQERRASFPRLEPEARISRWNKTYPHRLGDLAIPNRLSARIVIIIFASLVLALKTLSSQGSDLLRKLRNVHIVGTVQNLGSRVIDNIPQMILFSHPTDLEGECSQNAGQLTNTAPASTNRDSLDLAPFLEFKYYEKEAVDEEILKSYRDQLQNIAEALRAPKVAARFLAFPCSGWFHQPDKGRFGLTFQAPPGCIVPPVTLYQLIKEDKTNPTLEQRFAIAWRIGKALRKWHLAGFAHQGISSRNIFFFRTTTTSDPDFAVPYLSGFRHSQREGFSACPYIQDLVVHNRSYLDCQAGVSLPDNKLGDLFSYGLLLLEIGLWQLFPSVVSQRRRQKMKTDEMHRVIIETAQTRLAFLMGTNYRDSTIKCLEGDFGCESVDSGVEITFGTLVLDPIAPDQARPR